MANLSDLKPSNKKTVLIYGESGSGKTCFAASFPGPIHYYDFDGKVSSAAQYLKGSAKLGEISYDDCTPKKGFDPGAFINDEIGKIKDSGSVPYGTIVIDSLTTFADATMAYLMKMNPGIKRIITRGAQAPALQDYGIFRLYMKAFISGVLALPCNVVFTAHVHVDKDEHTGRLIYHPMMAGKLAYELPIYFEEVYVSYVKDGKYFAQTQADSKYQCRSQIRGLPKEIPLSYEELIKAR